jgi:hypothetical protein
MLTISSLASVVMIAKARIHSPEVGSFQFSNAAKAKRLIAPKGEFIGSRG